MKTMKKIASLLLALAMIFSLATTAFASGTNSITVNNAVENETYTIYKMLDLSINDPNNPTAFSYTVTAGWEDFFTSGEGKDYVTITNGYVTWNDNKKTPTDMITFGQAAKAAASGGTPQVANDTSITFAGLDNGYYLITSTLGTQVIVGSTPTAKDITIEEKNPEDTIVKTVKEDSTGDYGASNDAQIGDIVEFKSTATLYPYTTNVKIYDNMTSGLTYNTGTVKVDGLVKGTDYTVAENTTIDGTTYAFVITFSETYLAGLNAVTTLDLTYTAILNKNAAETTTVEGETATTAGALNSQKNNTKITYGDNQSVVAETTTTTHKFGVYKHATNKTENLAGAVFSLKKNGVVVNLVKIDETNYRVANGNEQGAAENFTTVASGDIVIWGVDADADYSLLETDAPIGYNKLTSEIPVTIDANNSTRIDVANNSGTELPSTGGMGTTLFYVIGGILVAAAAVLLVTKKRMAD